MTVELKPYYDVVISGCGPCGATLANMLGLQGVSTLVIDKEADILRIPRAVGMCDEGSRIVEATGVFNYAPVDFKELKRTSFANSDRETVFHFDMEKQINNHCMQRTFYQPQLEASIRKSLERFNCVELSPSTEMLEFKDADGEVTLSLDVNGQKTTVRSRFLVACDGARSPVRKQLGIGFSGRTYSQDWLIIDVGKSPFDSDEACFSVDPNRPGITLPLPHNKRRWEFVVKDSDDVESLFEEETLTKLLAPWGKLEDMNLERKAIYTFHARVASAYTKGNVFLAGDAAHITPPFAGQGMMAGLRDAQNLSWKLAGVINNTLDESVLESYDKERIQHSRQIVKFAEIIGKLVLPQHPFKAFLRDSFFRLMSLLGFYNQDKGFQMEKLPHHINGSLLHHFWMSKIKGTGVWFPQHRLTKEGETKNCDDWLGNRFGIVSWEHEPDNTLSPATVQRWRDVGGTFLHIRGGSNRMPTEYGYVDTDATYANYFRKNDTVVLRPDKIVAIKCSAADLETQLNRYLDTLCRKPDTPMKERAN